MGPGVHLAHAGPCCDVLGVNVPLSLPATHVVDSKQGALQLLRLGAIFCSKFHVALVRGQRGEND